MPITYSSAQVVDGGGSAPTNMTNLHVALRDAIIANPAWTVVEEFDLAPNRWTVLKCSAAQSGLPSDFHIAILRNTSTGAMNFAMFEGYNPTGRVITKAVANYSTGSTAANTSDGSWEGSITAASNGALNFSGLSASSSATYYLAVYNDKIVLLTNNLDWGFGTGPGGIYLGAFVSLVDTKATNDPMPLLLAVLGETASASQRWMSTRHPLPPSASFSYARAIANPRPQGSWGHWMPGACVDTGGPFGSGDRYQGGGKSKVCDVSIINAGGTSAAGSNAQGGLRGLMKDTKGLYYTSNPTGTAVGDYIVINGTRWMILPGTSTSAWTTYLFDTGVAA